jgi:hypothetical protein
MDYHDLNRISCVTQTGRGYRSSITCSLQKDAEQKTTLQVTDIHFLNSNTVFGTVGRLGVGIIEAEFKKGYCREESMPVGKKTSKYATLEKKKILICDEE